MLIPLLLTNAYHLRKVPNNHGPFVADILISPAVHNCQVHRELCKFGRKNNFSVIPNLFTTVRATFFDVRPLVSAIFYSLP